MAGVVLENVSRVYPGQVAAVDRVTLEVLDREFLVLVGPSGCGKTTLLRLVAGLEELTDGKIAIAGRVQNDVPPKHRDVAMVFQNYALYPHMTVYRNMAFGLELRENVNGFGRLWRWALPSARRAELAARRFSIAQRVHDAARVLGIEDLLERYPRQLSGGERQRVALGRAIVRHPAVFLFDEPLSNLDAKLRVEMRRELKQLHQRLGTTMVYVTHDQVEALTLGDRIAVMNAGKVQQVGPPMEVYRWPTNRFVAGFVGTPAMNLIDGNLEIDAKQGEPLFRRGRWTVSLAGRTLALPSGAPRRATLGVRPEDLRMVPDPAGRGLAAMVELVDRLGDATVVTLKVENATLYDGGSYQAHQDEDLNVVIKLEPRADLRPGIPLAVDADPTRIHLFDPETGENWVRGPVTLEN
jgi:multiple sugar transport system ATP-binding protein